jgi:RimJ/RimL family protein N-acetyltransferase
VPAPHLAGDGFTLVGLTDADAEVWLAGEDDVKQRAFEFPRGSTIEDVRRAIADWDAWWRTSGPVRQWGIRTDDGRLVGGVELRDLGGWTTANLAYEVFPDRRRTGLATSASRLAVRYAATLGVRTVRIKVLPWNAASKGVATALGATFVGNESSDAGGTFDVFELAVATADAQEDASAETA